MSFRSPHSAHLTQVRPATSGGDWWDDDERLGYVILEQGRVVCEQLLAQEGRSVRTRPLQAAHRDIGLAGYLFSDGIESRDRLGLLELVRDIGPVPTPPADSMTEQALMFAVHGAEVVDRLSADGLHRSTMLLAQRHVREAVRHLEEFVGPRSASRLRQRASAAGHLSPGWQRDHLAPQLWNRDPAIAR